MSASESPIRAAKDAHTPTLRLVWQFPPLPHSAGKCLMCMCFRVVVSVSYHVCYHGGSLVTAVQGELRISSLPRL